MLSILVCDAPHAIDGPMMWRPREESIVTHCLSSVRRLQHRTSVSCKRD